MNYQPSGIHAEQFAATSPSMDGGSLHTLCEMLTYRRVSGSRTEGKFIRRFIQPLGAKPDSFGNYVLRIGESPVMFSSHTDSVHRMAGRQHLSYHDGVVTLKNAGQWRKSNGTWHIGGSNCLGADDAVGCWIMREMAIAKVPGLYVWHRQEESGGVGSSYFAKANGELLQAAGIQAAIAFDRRGTGDVITHQSSGRCASDTFAESLAQQLPRGYKPSSHGIFTDTANYVDVIGECTNISVGYQDEHSSKESLDVMHAMTVKDAMLSFDHTGLVYSRKPGEIEPKKYYSYGNGSYGGYYSKNREEMWDDFDQEPYRSNHNSNGCSEHEIDDEPIIIRNDFEAMSYMIRHNATEVADILESCGYDAKTLRDELLQRGGAVQP